MRCYGRFWLGVLIELALISCVPQTAAPSIASTTTPTSTTTPHTPATDLYPQAPWCRKELRQPKGLSTDSGAENSYIIYRAYARDLDGQISGQTWSISVSDGTQKQIPHLPIDFFNLGDASDEYELMGNEFSLSSADGKHVAEWTAPALPPVGSYPLVIRDKLTNHYVEVFRTYGGDEIQGSWSPDGSHFAFTWNRDIADYYSVILYVNSDGSDLGILSGHVEHQLLERPYWSPDGKRIAIPFWDVARGGMGFMIVAFPAGTANFYKVTPYIRSSPGSTWGPNTQSSMTWSPDSKWFAYISDYGHRGVEILNVDTGVVFCAENDAVDYIDDLVWHADLP